MKINATKWESLRQDVAFKHVLMPLNKKYHAVGKSHALEKSHAFENLLKQLCVTESRALEDVSLSILVL